jgi:hypothetical protein
MHGSETTTPPSTIPTQNARTVLTRGVLDHTAQTINPRWQVMNGAVQSPRELLDGRGSGVVNVRMKDGIAPLPVSAVERSSVFSCA